MFQASASLKSVLENWLLRPDFYHCTRRADYVFSYGGKITDLIQERLHVSRQNILEIPGGIDSSWLSAGDT